MQLTSAALRHIPAEALCNLRRARQLTTYGVTQVECLYFTEMIISLRSIKSILLLPIAS